MTPVVETIIQDFVNREPYLTALPRIIRQEADWRVLLIGGLEGIGKTYLLREYREQCRAQGITCVVVDFNAQPSQLYVHVMNIIERVFDELGKEGQEHRSHVFERLRDLVPLPSKAEIPEANGLLGIPEAVLASLRTTLFRCDEFGSVVQLRAVFAAEELRPWQAGLPSADNVQGLVDRTIDYLKDKYRSNGENALVLLLRMLAGRSDPADERHGQLNDLVEQVAVLAQQLRRSAIAPAPSQFERLVELVQQDAKSAQQLIQDRITEAFRECLIEVTRERPVVFVLDAWQQATTPLAAWLRDNLLTWIVDEQLAGAVAIVAGREVPYADWLRTRFRRSTLPPLPEDAVRIYWIEKRGLSAEHLPSVLQLSKGHPKILALMADMQDASQEPLLV